MLRRILCLILVPALLANQAVLCCAHTHGGSESSDHSQQAHVHYSGHSHDSGHHHHGESGDHHHDESDQSEPSNEAPVDQSTPVASLDTSAPCGHDHDVIYIGEQADLHLPTSRISTETSTVVGQWLLNESPPVVQSQPSCHFTRAGPLGLYSADQCAIYLQTCRLLI